MGLVMGIIHPYRVAVKREEESVRWVEPTIWLLDTSVAPLKLLDFRGRNV